MLDLLLRKNIVHAGFDISPEGITGIVLGKEKNVLLKAIFKPFKENVFQSGAIVNKEIFIKTLSEFADIEYFNTNTVNISLPIAQTFVKTIILPDLPENELKVIIPQEAAKHLPFSAREANIDFEILRQLKKTGSSKKEAEVLIVALNKTIAKNYADIFVEAGFNISAIDISPFAVIKTLANAGYIDETDKLYLSVVIGYESTDINIICKGMPLFFHNIPLGKKQVLESLSLALEISEKDSEKMLPEIALVVPGAEFNADPYINKASNAIRTVYNNITGEVLKITEFYFSQNNQGEISKIIMSGSGICVQNIDKYTANRTKTETVILNPLKNIDISSLDEHDKDMNSGFVIPSLAVSTGLALKG